VGVTNSVGVGVAVAGGNVGVFVGAVVPVGETVGVGVGVAVTVEVGVVVSVGVVVGVGVTVGVGVDTITFRWINDLAYVLLVLAIVRRRVKSPLGTW
jgi:hypothetical protein